MPCSTRSLNSPSPEVLRQSGRSGRSFLALDGTAAPAPAPAPPGNASSTAGGGGGYVLVATSRDPTVFIHTATLRQSTNDWASGGLEGAVRALCVSAVRAC